MSYENNPQRTPIPAKYWKAGTNEKGKWDSALQFAIAVFCSAECSHEWEFVERGLGKSDG